MVAMFFVLKYYWKHVKELKGSLLFGRSVQTEFVRLDQDILTPLAGKKMLYTYETDDFWEQIKTPG
jgi:hypothetical protein